MKLAHFISVFAGIASAIDVYNHQGTNCGGAYSLCVGLPPDFCCGVINSYQSVAFLGIPTNWNLELRAHGGGQCATLFSRRNHFGSTNACLSGGIITGGGYSFRNVKRGVIDAPETKCVKPNEVGFADGVKYDLTLLDVTAGDQILEIVGTGGSSTDVPVEYIAGKISV